MEAPEKIYVHEASAPELTEKLPYHIEYTRTDYAEKIFLHTVNAWLAEIHRVCYITDENGYQIELEKLQASFKRYMKGK